MNPKYQQRRPITHVSKYNYLHKRFVLSDTEQRNKIQLYEKYILFWPISTILGRDPALSNVSSIPSSVFFSHYLNLIISTTDTAFSISQEPTKRC
jgi:hypothetical protein